ncbi:MAG: indolepyruvate ferredoxin oxidoreductase subunit alpha [Kofleriaceae bacterium]
MAYVITSKCAGVCDTACVKACPVDCILGPVDGQMVIDPDDCICCGACVQECPVDAIVDEEAATPIERAFNADAAARLRRG